MRRWELDRADSLKDFIARVNRIRRESPALQQDYSLQFFDVNNDNLLCYAKNTPDNAEIILVVANLDPHHIQSGWVTLPLDKLGLDSASFLSGTGSADERAFFVEWCAQLR